MVLDRSLRVRILRRAVAAALIAAAALGSTGRAAGQEPAEEEWSIERIDRTVEVVGKAALTIENLHGDLRVRVGEPGRIEAHAVAQRHAEDPRRAALGSDATDGTSLRVELDGAAGDEDPPSWQRRRVDLVVAVPPGAKLRLRTASGLIEVKGEVGVVEAESGRGDVRLWVPSECRIRTAQGSIHAYLLGPAWSRAARFETVDGSIEIELPASADVLLEAETSGRLTTDFSIEVSWPSLRRKRAVSKLGEGRAKVLARSENGSISLLRRMPREAPPEGLGGADPLR